jgi:hypothetical protein
VVGDRGRIDAVLPLTHIKAVVQDAVAAHLREFGEALPPTQHFARLSGDLDAVSRAEFDQEGTDLAILESRWQVITDSAFAKANEFTRLLARIDMSREPAALATTLFGPLNRDLDEVSHTRVIGRLLDSGASGALGAALLRAVMSEVLGPSAASEITDPEIVGAHVKIEPEWCLKRRRQPPLYLFPDIVVEISRQPRPLLMVIENKIRARDGDGQLDNYAERARQRVDAEVVLV